MALMRSRRSGNTFRCGESHSSSKRAFIADSNGQFWSRTTNLFVAQIRLNVAAFLQQLFRQGAFQGITPREAYFVKCDAETTTQNDIDTGVVNVMVGFAPLRPAEFVIVKISTKAARLK
jgi:phage tail sheath protein FI